MLIHTLMGRARDPSRGWFLEGVHPFRFTKDRLRGFAALGSPIQQPAKEEALR